ncbi:biotin--[acetyl-CoA-carboxylase] ligase [Nocardioides limicola]|uniref:biotin--[acetyl-CoA-carboxylase] ligase n=1 Tax=Nocardioides limicola TaxID=2803368 RepID=UPI001EF00DEA|nr:biotin--[acetyl-CoA-carboxylase] ligase [Nocardioides sp. DJM-14]
MTDAARTRPPLDPDRLAQQLADIVATVDVREESGSSNADAAELARAGAPHGTVVVVEHQTSGRGRLDRTWVSPARAALTFSVLLRPEIPPQAWPWLPLVTGYAVQTALAEAGVETGLKWPNDVLLGDRKVAGILVERVETDTGPVAVVGIGLNVTTTAAELPIEEATSIAEATGQTPDRTALLAGLVRALLSEYDAWLGQGAATLREKYAARCVTLGRVVRVALPDGSELRGTATGIDGTGRLMVETDAGTVPVGAGDVVHVRAEAEFSEQVEQLVLGGAREWTAEQVAAEAGLSMLVARRLWRALGFAEPGTEVAFTAADKDALTDLAEVMDERDIDVDTAVNLTRGIGQTVARLADWEVAGLVQYLSPELLRDPQIAVGLLEHLNPPFERMLVYAWRRHLAAALARQSAMFGGDERGAFLTVGFADLVSFTELSNEIGEERIGDLVEVFESRCADVIANNRGRVIKSLGDSVLFVNDDPGAALETAEGIIAVIGRDQRMPDVRLGLASGQVTLRLGDVFGPPVNLASRLTQVARRNRLIIDQATADRLPEGEFEYRRMPARPLHGFGLVEPITVRRA